VTSSSQEEISLLLRAWCGGSNAALDKLMPLVYEELRRIAHRHMVRERAGHTLQTTALVNEAYLRLVDARQVQWRDRAHFFALSAQLMRRILVDHARSRSRLKRGGSGQRVPLDESSAVPVAKGTNLVELDDALSSLAAVDARKAKVVELRYFGGLSVKETAEALDVSAGTVMSDWKLAKVWLLRQLDRSGKQHESGKTEPD
jgi:RNA polymerase sigma factor (TIGR02999 family)